MEDLKNGMEDRLPFFYTNYQSCELDRFLTEFEFKRYLPVRIVKILFFEFGKMTKFEFAALDFIGRNGMNK